MFKTITSILVTLLLISCVQVSDPFIVKPKPKPLPDDGTFTVGTPDSGGGTRASTDGENPRDLERMAAVKEQEILAARAEQISAQFGLSNERGVELARIYDLWSKKSSVRTLSQVEQDQFSLRVLGTDFATFKAATKRAIQGDTHLLDQIAEKAAVLNGTGPEQMREILNNILIH